MSKIIFKSITPLLIITAVCGFTSCSIKSGRGSSLNGSNSSLYQSFYVGEEGTQYYIDRILFENQHSKCALLSDYTFRHNNSKSSAVTFNFSLSTPVYISTLDSLSMVSEVSSLILKDIKIMFTEKNGDYYVSRFTTTLSLKDLKSFFQSENPKMEVYSNQLGVDHLFIPVKQTAKKIKRLNQDLFFIF